MVAPSAGAGRRARASAATTSDAKNARTDDAEMRRQRRRTEADVRMDDDDEDDDEDDEDEEEDEDEDEDEDDEARPPRRLVGRAPRAAPLTEDDIRLLTHEERRKVLGRWNARLRGLKKKVSQLSGQFPTSSFVVLFTKPIPTLRKAGKWSEEEFQVRGPIARTRAPWRQYDRIQFSGKQILRKTLSELLGTPMDEEGNPEDADGEPMVPMALPTTEGADDADTLFKELQPFVAEANHKRIAYALTNAPCVGSAGLNPNSLVWKLSEEYRLEQAERTSARAAIPIAELERFLTERARQGEAAN